MLYKQLSVHLNVQFPHNYSYLKYTSALVSTVLYTIVHFYPSSLCIICTVYTCTFSLSLCTLECIVLFTCTNSSSLHFVLFTCNFSLSYLVLFSVHLYILVNNLYCTLVLTLHHFVLYTCTYSSSLCTVHLGLLIEFFL